MTRPTYLFIATIACLGVLTLWLYKENDRLKADSERVRGELTIANEKLERYEFERNQLNEYFRKRIEASNELLKKVD